MFIRFGAAQRFTISGHPDPICTLAPRQLRSAWSWKVHGSG